MEHMEANLTAFLESPATLPPPGITRNRDHPPNQKILSIVLPSISIFLAIFVVTIRGYARATITRKFGLPDLVVYCGIAAFIGFCVTCFLASNAAPGIHVWDASPENICNFIHFARIGAVLYMPTIFLIRLSIARQYIQVFMPNKKPTVLYWLTISFIVVNFVGYAALLVLHVLSCKPVDNFVIGPEEGHCIDFVELNTARSSFNLVSDAAIMVLPQPIIWRLRLPIRQRVVVSTICIIALLAIGAVSMHLYHALQLRRSADITWHIYNMGVWSLVEMDFGLIAGWIPYAGLFLRSLVQKGWYVNLSTSLSNMTTWRGGPIIDKQELRSPGIESRAATHLEQLEIPSLGYESRTAPHVAQDLSPFSPKTNPHVISELDGVAIHNNFEIDGFIRVDGPRPSIELVRLG